MKTGLLIALIGFALLGLSSQDAAAVLITFDTVPSGTNIDTQYAALGVTFGCFNGNDAAFNQCSATHDAFAVASLSAKSSPNVIGLTSTDGDLVDERIGFFRASFTTSVNTVSIDAMPVPLPEQLGTVTNAPFLQAFNSGGMFLGQTVYPGVGTCDPTVANSCPYKTLTFTRPSADIAFVAFSSFHAGGPTIFGEFDNLSFPGPTAVPEPSSLFLLGTGLTALGSHVWKRHRITGREPGDRRANREEARVPTGHWMPANWEHLWRGRDPADWTHEDVGIKLEYTVSRASRRAGRDSELRGVEDSKHAAWATQRSCRSGIE